MTTSTRSFLVELYEEYLDEASFLYEQRLSLFQDPEIAWNRIREYEERLEAHLDGLVVGDRLALDVCTQHALEGDFGELYAAMCVFCRQDRRDLALSTLYALDPNDSEKVCAVSDALKYELPPSWSGDFRSLLGSGDHRFASILARVLGYQRVQCGPQLLTAMKGCDASALPEICWALGRIAYEPAVEPLFHYLCSGNDSVCVPAAIALLRMGDRRAVDYCLDQARFSTWPILPLGLAGSRRALELLTDLVEKSSRADCVTALGMVGDAISAPLLLSLLKQPETVVQAASALHYMTAAGLYETVFIPDDMDEDESLDSRREEPGPRQGRADGRRFGSKVTRLSQNPEDWNRWWERNADDFTPGVRYRNGLPLSPGQLVRTLASEQTPYLLRYSCSEELVMRYGRDFGLETDMPVGRQITVLSEAAAWSESRKHAFEEGAWYFAGLPL
jgi:uncharacterized protein (TIGR02270 family)